MAARQPVRGRAVEEPEPARPPVVVFADASQRRWRRIRAVACGSVTMLLAGIILAGWHVFDNPRGPARGPAVTSADLARAALIGSGPLVRLVEIRAAGTGGTAGTASTAGAASSLHAYDAATGADAGAVSEDDAARAAGRRYALQRYGYLPGSSRLISLTFDDGPDARFTPLLLDLLSREHVPGTFFDVGNAAASLPDVVERERREGHAVGNHSMTHPDLSEVPWWRAEGELVWADRTLRALTGEQTPLVRLPYEGADEASMADGVAAVWAAQRLGYVVASHDFDSLDWLYESGAASGEIPLPSFDGSNITVLMHDGGGDRTRTLAYVERLIRAARAAGYTFATMPAAQKGMMPGTGPARADVADEVALGGATLLFAMPPRMLDVLFAIALASVALGLMNGVVAGVRAVRRRHRVYLVPYPGGPAVSVVVAAYNEEAVIGRTVLAALASGHPLREVLIVDDGSTDATAAVVAGIAATDPRVRLLRQDNAGKAMALNHGLMTVDSDVVVTMDADTLLMPSTVGRLVRHFAAEGAERLGAVAGVVRVGNRTRNLLTRWQALEYLTQIGVERGAQDAMGAIAIVPGACAAWRREAILGAGGYSAETLAEDCDLSLCLHEAGWRITQDDEAVAWTEAPEDVDGLLAQRVRWSYGTLQAVWKHRRLLLNPRYGWLGLLVLPNYVLSILLPVLFLPLTTITAVLMVQQQGWGKLAMYVGVLTGGQFLVAAVAVLVMGESPRHLLMVPVYRLAFEPLRAYLVYTSTYMALRGVRAGWNKLARSGALDTGAIPLAALAGRTAGRPAGRPAKPEAVSR